MCIRDRSHTVQQIALEQQARQCPWPNVLVNARRGIPVPQGRLFAPAATATAPQGLGEPSRNVQTATAPHGPCAPSGLHCAARRAPPPPRARIGHRHPESDTLLSFMRRRGGFPPRDPDAPPHAGRHGHMRAGARLRGRPECNTEAPGAAPGAAPGSRSVTGLSQEFGLASSQFPNCG